MTLSRTLAIIMERVEQSRRRFFTTHGISFADGLTPEQRLQERDRKMQRELEEQQRGEREKATKVKRAREREERREKNRAEHRARQAAREPGQDDEEVGL